MHTLIFPLGVLLKTEKLKSAKQNTSKPTQGQEKKKRKEKKGKLNKI